MFWGRKKKKELFTINIGARDLAVAGHGAEFYSPYSSLNCNHWQNLTNKLIVTQQ